MEDVTDTVFRQLIAKWGPADVYFTEFTNAEGLGSAGKERVLHRWKYTEVERPLVAQIWGINPEMHYESAKMAAKLGFDGVDINMGCPVKKIVKKGACSALINNPDLAAEIIKATQEGAGGLPISVKTRIGFDKIATEDWVTFLLNQKIQALTLHGRIAKQMSDKKADWLEIEKAVSIKNTVSPETILIGNGDVKSLKEIDEKVQSHKVDGVMIGRGIFEDVVLFNPNKSIGELSTSDKLNLLKEHIELFTKTWGDDKGYYNLKKYFKIYIKGFDGAVKIRSDLMQTKSAEEGVNYINNLNNELA